MYLKKIKAKGQLGFELEFNQKNIILGENSTGKSTLINLIIYVLGSRVDNFIEEIREGQLKQVELDIECKSGNSFRLIRALPQSDIITVTPINEEGELMEEEVELLTLPEFSDFLLKEEGYSIKNIAYGNNQHASIRLYFLLRAVLVDQNTSAASVLSSIGGSNSGYINNQKLIKKAIIEELLGTENNLVQKKRFELQQRIKERKELNSKYKSVKEIIEKQLEENEDLERDQDTINKRIEGLDKEKQIITQAQAENLLKLKNLIADEERNQLIKYKEQRNKILTSIRKVHLELLDIDKVTNKLTDEVKELKRKIAARQFITQIPVDKCPACLSPLTIHTEENCPLCHGEIDNSELENTLRYKKMLEESIAESNVLKEEIENELDTLQRQRDDIDKFINKYEEAQIQELKEKQGPIEEIINSIKQRYQEIIQQNELLKNFYKTLEFEEELKEEKKELDTEVKELREELTEMEQSKSITELDKISEWERIFKETLEEVFGDVNTIELDENYLPLVNKKETSKLSSASLKVATRLSYILSLFMLNNEESISINHLNLVMFDSPRDKDLDQDKYKKFLEIINEIDNGQIILTGSIEDSSYAEVFDESVIDLRLYENDKLLK